MVEISRRVNWWLIFGVAGVACLWLAYLSNTGASRWLGLGFLLTPVLATLFSFGRQLAADRVTTLALAFVVFFLCTAWFL